jgi:hypothetical protein
MSKEEFRTIKIGVEDKTKKNNRISTTKYSVFIEC